MAIFLTPYGEKIALFCESYETHCDLNAEHVAGCGNH